MAKTKEELQAIVDEIKAVCGMHGVYLVATCAEESVYGEIIILEPGKKSTLYSKPEERVNNTVCLPYDASGELWSCSEDPWVAGIGTVE